MDLQYLEKLIIERYTLEKELNALKQEKGILTKLEKQELETRLLNEKARAGVFEKLAFNLVLAFADVAVECEALEEKTEDNFTRLALKNIVSRMEQVIEENRIEQETDRIKESAQSEEISQDS